MDIRPDPNQPESVGPYELLAPIARGGMGVVFRALDPRAGREVALKVLPAGGSPPAQRRLLREAQALAQLQHPNVVQVHDAGESTHGPYVALELVEGGSSLGDRVAKRGPLTPARAVEIATALADALQACHAVGILHRDVKPSNVLLAPDGRPLLTDFGLALQSADSLTRLSQDGAILGTPGFFPPEQARGKLDQIDERSDVYGLGATLYALLTGRAPVEGSTLAEVVIATQHQDATPPSDSRPEVDPGLDRIVLRCLERDPARRFESAGDVAKALRAYARGEVVGPRRRGPILLGGLVLGAAGIGAAMVLLTGEPPPAPTPPPRPSSAPLAMAEPSIPLQFNPPPIGLHTRLRCRFDQTYRSRASRQIFSFEVVSTGEVVKSGQRSIIDGHITRVLGRISDHVNDLRFDTAHPEQTTDTARLVAGDLIALVGRPLRASFAHNDTTMLLDGLPKTARIAGNTIEPATLAARRIRTVHGCFPIPLDRTEWKRSFPFSVQAAFRLREGQVNLRCRRVRTADGMRLEYEAGPRDVTWKPLKPSVPPLTDFHLRGRSLLKGGWVSSARVDVRFKGRVENEGAFEFASTTVYSVEATQ